MTKRMRTHQCITEQEKQNGLMVVGVISCLADVYTPVRLVRPKSQKKFTGTVVGASHRPVFRKGGGFSLWILYNGTVLNHTTASQHMVQDFVNECRQQRPGCP